MLDVNKLSMEACCLQFKHLLPGNVFKELSC